MAQESQLPPAVLANPYVMRTLAIAQQYNLNVRWMRTLDITVLEARDLKKMNWDGKTNDAQCLVRYNGSVRETSEVNGTDVFRWRKAIQFKLFHMPNKSVIFELVNRNNILMNDPLGQVVVSPNQMVEGQIVDLTLPVKASEGAADATGQLSLTIRLSTPWPDNFRFVMNHNYFSISNFSIKDTDGRTVFRIEGSWPTSFSFKDTAQRKLLHIEKRSLVAIEPSYDMYVPGNPNRIMEITKRVFGASYDIIGPNGPIRVSGDLWNWNYKFYNHSNRLVGSVYRDLTLFGDSYIVEIDCDQDLLLFLSCAMVIDKTRPHHRR